VPVERAALARAAALEPAGHAVLDNDLPPDEALLGAVLAAIGEEWRKFAEELHWH
jgi:hypothetical protein